MALITAGICIGAGICVSMGQQPKGDIASFLENFLRFTQQEQPDISAIFSGALVNTLEIGLFLWLCGLTRLGLFIAPAIAGLRGFMVGFTVAALVQNFAAVGFLAAAVGILPQMLLMLPCLLVFAVVAMKNAAFLRSGPDSAEKRRRFFAYNVVCAILLLMLMVCALIEGYISPFLIRWAFSFV